jgi:hypothetical protein
MFEVTRAWHWRLQRVSVILLAGALTVLGSCNAADEALTAAQRLTRASTKIAPRVGASADEVERGFRLRLAGLSDDAIALQAERTAQRTAWIDDAIARFAQERAKTAKVVHSAACDWLEIRQAFAEETPEARSDAFYDIIVGHLRAEGLSESEDRIREVWETVSTQIEALDQGGSLEVEELATDLACLF